MNEAHLLHLLKEEQVKFAVQALKQPAQRDAFEYGHRAGIYAGLDLAIALITRTLEDANTKDL